MHFSKRLSTNKLKMKKAKKYHDLTATTSENSVVFPGDPTYQSDDIYSLNKGSPYHLCHMHLGNHTGTHIDFPSHVIEGGKTSNDFPIEHLIGEGLIIEVPYGEEAITEDLIARQPILFNDFVFFKTANSALSKQSQFDENYIYLEIEAAEALLERKVKIVGIDYVSVDQYKDKHLPVHKLLLSNDVLIVEGLELKHAPIGRCKIYIMPTKINCMDGLPARVIAEI